MSRAPHDGEFSAMGEALQRLAGAGYAPRIVIDVGANVGQWARLARAAFPGAILHCVEPQAACAPALGAVCAALGRATAHRVALSDVDGGTGRMQGGGGDGSTGAWLEEAAGEGEEVPLRTLDALLGADLASDDRVLLKLDVEGHERRVLAGAARVLAVTEVLIAEWSCYRPGEEESTSLEDLVALLVPLGFVLHDVASLSRRARDGRLRQGDAVFVRATSSVRRDRGWS